MEDKKSDDTINYDFSCELCDYNTCHRGHWKKHIESKKHKIMSLLYVKTKSGKKVTTAFSRFVCYCGKQYNQGASLNRHKKTCKFIENELEEIDKGTYFKKPENSLKREIPKNEPSIQQPPKDNTNTDKVLLDKKTYDLMEENSKLKDSMINVLQSNPTIVSNGDNNTINTNHNTLKINVYLDQNYQEAMNLEDFVQNIQYSIEDLNITANQGIVKGVSNIFKKNLETLDPKSRPIHCGDVKGNQLYIRDANRWEKDKGKLNVEIDNVAKKQITMISEWEAQHPNWFKNEALTHQYLNLVRQLTSTDNNGENEQIRRNLAKYVMLDEIVIKNDVE